MELITECQYFSQGSPLTCRAFAGLKKISLFLTSSHSLRCCLVTGGRSLTPWGAQPFMTALDGQAGANQFSSLVTPSGGGCVLFACVSSWEGVDITVRAQKFFPIRQTDMKRCYRTWLRKCSGKIQADKELVLFIFIYLAFSFMFPLCILEMAALLTCQSVPPTPSENLHLSPR